MKMIETCLHNSPSDCSLFSALENCYSGTRNVPCESNLREIVGVQLREPRKVTVQNSSL